MNQLSFCFQHFKEVLKTTLSHRKVLIFLFLTLWFRYWLASMIPLGNDEAYYWDWARDLSLSYYDHPPGVSWLAYLGRLIAPDILWNGRLLVPVVHLLLTLVLIAVATLLNEQTLNELQIWVLLFGLELLPITNLGGFMLMPDVGLLLFSAIFLYGLLFALKYSWLRSTSFLLILGLVWGLAFVNKYHGLVLGGTAFAYFLYRTFENWPSFFKTCFTVGIGFFVASSPVWLWNINHDFISFRFQAAHGFAAPKFHLEWGLRILLIECILFTPIVIMMLSKSIKQERDPGSQLLMAASLPLLIIFIGVSFFKEVLPHWLLPSIWLLMPLLIWRTPHQRWLKFNAAFSFTLTFVLIAALGSGTMREKVIDLMDQKPQGLGEITLWPYLVSDLKDRGYWPPRKLASTDFRSDEQGRCGPNGVILGSFKWFWSAQLALHLPGQPSVTSFDPLHLSYYSFRDSEQDWAGCKVLLIGDRKHFHAEHLANWVETVSVETFFPTKHLDRETVVVRGVMKSNQFHAMLLLSRLKKDGKSVFVN